jgi:Mitochondrial carrier protein
MDAEPRAVDDRDDSWVEYSDMDKSTYSSMLTALGVGSSLLTQPFSVVTTRQQAGQHVTGDPHYSSVYGSMRGYVQTLGWRGLFRGWAPIALMGVPSQLTYLTITEATRESFQKTLKNFLPSLPSAVIDGLQSAGTSVVANAVSYVPYVPAEVISSRMMVQGRRGNGMTQTMRVIWKEDGFRGFYRGFNASLMYGILLSMQWWWSYSVSRREFSKTDLMKTYPFLLDATTGLIAGVTSTCIAHPLDTLKTRIMTGNKVRMPLMETLRGIWKKEGYRALFRGISANVYQAGLTSMGFSICYEAVKKFSMNAGDEHHAAEGHT